MKCFLKVYLWGEEIGRLAWHDTRKLTYFNFNPEFLRGNLDIAPIVASIHSPVSKLAIFGETERIYQKLPSFIADSLPDSWGNQLFEQWRRQQRITDRSVTPLEKLAFIGRRGMGALEFVPEIDRGITPGNISIKALTDLAQKIVEERENVLISPEEDLTMQSLITVGTSAGGRQPKGIIAINTKTNEIRSGQVDTDPAFEYFLLKFGNNQLSLADRTDLLSNGNSLGYQHDGVAAVGGGRHKAFSYKTFRQKHLGQTPYSDLGGYESRCRKLRKPYYRLPPTAFA